MLHEVVGAIGFIVVVVLLAALGSRLLGVRLSLRQAVLTGFPAWWLVSWPDTWWTGGTQARSPR